MGNVIDKCVGRQRRERKINLLLLGLDNAGKTKTANNLTGQIDRDVCPTVGFRAYNLVHRRYPVVIYDLGGGSGFRGIWDQYYSDVHGVIFVVDSTDLGRLEECREVLRTVLAHEKISGKPLLILANKQDKEGALDDVDLVERLDIEAVVNKYRCPTTVEAYTASPSERYPKQNKKQRMDPGLKKGYSWLLNYIIQKYGDINLRVQTDVNTEKTKRKLKAKQKEIGTTTDEMLTSFENPNYVERTDADGSTSVTPVGVIVVKEASNRSIDYDAIEVAEVEEDKLKNEEKLSSVFGDKLENGTIEKPIELEARTNVRKLSPIVRGRFTVTTHDEGRMRPQTSPSIMDSPSIDKNREIAGDFVRANHSASVDKYSNEERTERNSSGRVVDVGLMTSGGVTGGPMSGKRQVLPPIGKIDNTTGSPSSWDASIGNVAVTSPKAIRQNSLQQPKRPTTHSFENSSSQEDHSGGDARPQSATQGIREQLEKTKDSIKKKMSLKSLKRNRTSPEIKSSLFSYDPSTSKPYANHDQQTEDGEFSAKAKNFGRVGLRSDTVM